MRTLSTLLSASLIAGLAAASPALANETATSWTTGKAAPAASAVPAAKPDAKAKSATAQQSAGVAGIYSGVNDSSDVYLQLMNQGFHTVVWNQSAPQVVVIGQVEVTGDTITFQDLAGCAATDIGTYNYAVSPQGITLNVVEDACAERAAALSGKAMTRVNPQPVMEASNPQ